MLGDVTQKTPRAEFNDLSVLSRLQVDKMAFNVYQPNNGDGFPGDEINNWKSRAIRPITRNKIISIAAHSTAKYLFPKIFAYDQANEEQKDAAQVMSDLMEWAAERSNYAKTSLHAIITALFSPASIIYTEYAEATRTIRKKQEDGTWKEEQIEDEVYSGFQDKVVPVDELYIENFYEEDIQKQGWLIWRRVLSFNSVQTKYQAKYPEFKYVKPGVQLILSDANQTFYQVYDSSMRKDMCEEIIFYHRGLDLKLISVNGVLLTDPDNPNPREDKAYPFTKFGYELIDEGRCFYYKSLAFKIQSDDRIINTLWPIMIDGAYLNVMPPMVNRGGEMIASDVIVPGAVTTLSSPDAKLEAIQTSTSQGLNVAMNTMQQLEQSVSESTLPSILEGGLPGGKRSSAYGMSIIEKNAETILGLFVQMIAEYVKQFGKLRLGDIMQYMTIAETNEIEGNTELVYKTFFLPNKMADGKTKTRKLSFDLTLPTGKVSKADILKHSYATKEKESDHTQLYRIAPDLFRKLKYWVTCNAQTVSPMSEDVEKQYNLEAYDRLIANPKADQEQVLKDFLLGSYTMSKKDPEKYMVKEDPNAMPGGLPGMPGMPPTFPGIQQNMPGQQQGQPAKLPPPRKEAGVPQPPRRIPNPLMNPRMAH